MKVLYDAVVGPGAGEYYGTIIVSGFQYEDGTPVDVRQFLSMNFTSPAAVADTDINGTFMSWVQVTPHVQSTQIDTATFSVSAQLDFAETHAMDLRDQFTIGINGDLTHNPDTYLNSFVFAADAAPDVNGTASVDCAAAPDAALAGLPPILTFSLGSQQSELTLSYGTTTSVALMQGAYSVSGNDVCTDDETVSAPLIIAPAQITVVPNQTVPVSVTFGPVQRYSALDIAIGALSGLATETLDVAVVDEASGQNLASFAAGINSSTQLRKLPASGTALIQIGNIALNNTKYSFSIPAIELENMLHEVLIDDSMVQTAPVDTTGYVKVPVNITVEKTVARQITLRLSSESMNYTQTVSVSTQETAFSAPVKPGTYSVRVDDFVCEGTVFAVRVADTLVVADDGTTALDLSVDASANLNVPGFPAFLSFGGCADLTPGNQADFVAARASSLFNYAGVDGAGDDNTYLTDDQSTRQAIQLARNVEAALDNGQTVLPVMISYTCNLSLGNTPGMLANADQHAHSFANFILALNLANDTIDANHPVPAGFIVNPDFLGACQQAGFGASYGMPVRAPLQTALDHWSVEAVIPATVTEDIRGYVEAVNWLVRTVAPKVVFGWQINLWGVGYSEWLYQDSDPATFAQQTAAYVQGLQVYNGPNPPDFLAIDRYEADDFTQRGYVNGYCYSPREWERFFDFCKTVSRALKVPVMPWQIPASRTPATADAVYPDFDSQHWGSGGSYMLGDPAIGSDYHNINPTILALEFPEPFQTYMGQTAEDLFAHAEPFDISGPAYGDFPVRGIFAVLLGGGSTTGIISTVGNPEPWVRDKLNAYMAAPIGFDSASSRPHIHPKPRRPIKR
jgi:hypothetical protein